MKIYFLRHQEAEPRLQGKPDSERRLTEAGANLMKDEAIGMKKKGILFDLVATSPLKRSVESAEIIAKEMGYNEDILKTDLLLPGTTYEKVLKLLKENIGKKSLLLVGHEPDFGKIIATITASIGQEPLPMKKGALCCVESAGESLETPGSERWKICGYYPAEMLARAASRS